jgi:hypothetical protein
MSVIVRLATSSPSSAAGDVRQVVEDEVAVDLVGAEQEIVAHAEFAELHQLVAPPDAGDRVVRVAEVEQFRLRA